MSEKKARLARKGRQTPTQGYILPYEKSYGQEAIDLYNSSGRTAQEWQELLLFDILAVNEDGLYVHSRFGEAVPRRNGKNEVVVIRELWGLKHGEHILHTAHLTSTAHMAWDRLYKIIQMAGLDIKSSYKAFGKEHIELQGGGKIEFRTRTSKGGLGEGFDLMIIDEAQEYTDDQESALKYVVSSSQNPQTIFCGTPPTPVSSGTVFKKLRDKVLSGQTENAGWAEWSVDRMTDPYDVDAWYETNPSLGTILTERVIKDEIGNDDVDFNIQRLGLWLSYNQHSAISENEWKELQVEQLPKLKGKLYVGIKYGVTGKNVALSIAVKTENDKVFTEVIDCRPTNAGNNWIISFLRQADIQEVVIDGQSGQSLLVSDMKDVPDLKLKPVLPRVSEVIEANSNFETKGVHAQMLCHKGQPSLSAVASNCEHRAIGTGGGFGYRSLKDELDIALLDSVILAYWACSKAKVKKKQVISY